MVTCADYKPFSYYAQGDLVGFDVDLVRAIAHKMGRDVSMRDLDFLMLFPTVHVHIAHAAIGGVESTAARSKHLDFSIPYYHAGYMLVTLKSHTFDHTQLQGKIIGLQVGTTLTQWVKQKAPTTHVQLISDIRLSLEALRAGHMDAIILDEVQAQQYCQKHKNLQMQRIPDATIAYKIVLAKGSPLTQAVNQAIRDLEREGFLRQLHKKYLEVL